MCEKMQEQILIKTNIKAHLPYGGLSKIARSVSEKLNKKIHVSQVRNVCDPAMSSWDADIIEAAQNLIIARNVQLISAKQKLV